MDNQTPMIQPGHNYAGGPPSIVNTDTPTPADISIQLQKYVSKYKLEGLHDLWITPSREVIDPYEELGQMIKGKPEDFLFYNGFVKASLDIYPGRAFAATLVGTAKDIARVTDSPKAAIDQFARPHHAKALSAVPNPSESDNTYTSLTLTKAGKSAFQEGWPLFVTPLLIPSHRIIA